MEKFVVVLKKLRPNAVWNGTMIPDTVEMYNEQLPEPPEGQPDNRFHYLGTPDGENGYLDDKPTLAEMEAEYNVYAIEEAKTNKKEQLSQYYDINKNFTIEFNYSEDSIDYSTKESIDFSNLQILQNIKTYVPTFDRLLMEKENGRARIQIVTANLSTEIEKIIQRNVNQGLAYRAHSQAIDALITEQDINDYDFALSIAIVAEDTELVKIETEPYIIDLNNVGWDTTILKET